MCLCLGRERICEKVLKGGRLRFADARPTKIYAAHARGRNVGEQETQSWALGLNEHDGGAVRDLGADGMIYMINYDNAYHVRYRQQQRGDIARDVVTEKYILGMRILLMGYEHAFRTLREANRDRIAEYLDEFRRMAARGAASTVLALAENLPKIVDTSSVAGDIE